MVKMVGHYEVLLIFLGIEHQLHKNMLRHFLHYNSL